jgi:hypothetical protein
MRRGAEGGRGSIDKARARQPAAELGRRRARFNPGAAGRGGSLSPLAAPEPCLSLMCRRFMICISPACLFLLHLIRKGQRATPPLKEIVA